MEEPDHHASEVTLSMAVDVVDLEVVKASLSGIVQEMQNSLFRTGFSTIVRESQDASCALMNAKGEVVAQHVVLPLHIGAFPACCGAIIAEFGDTIAEGDAFLINHPYQGGSPHAPSRIFPQSGTEYRWQTDGCATPHLEGRDVYPVENPTGALTFSSEG